MLQEIRKIRYSATLFAGVVALGLTACGDNGTKGTTSDGSGKYEVAGDHAIGDPNAPITVVEYASVTCTHCATWHTTVYDDFKEQYVDTGKVRYVFREFRTAPINMATAGFKIANCAGEEEFFNNVSLQMETLNPFLQAYSAAPASERGDMARERYERIGKAAGLTDAEYKACLRNEDLETRFRETEARGFEQGVTGTPSFFINGEKAQDLTLEDFAVYFADNGLDDSVIVNATPAEEPADTEETVTEGEANETDAPEQEESPEDDTQD